jgi:hypothetical protein
MFSLFARISLIIVKPEPKTHPGDRILSAHEPQKSHNNRNEYPSKSLDTRSDTSPSSFIAINQNSQIRTTRIGRMKIKVSSSICLLLVFKDRLIQVWAEFENEFCVVDTVLTPLICSSPCSLV